MKEKKISPEEIDHLADLARIEISSEERVLFTKQLNEILDYLDALNQIPTDKVSATFYLQDVSTPLRRDHLKDSLKIKEVLKNAPEKENQFFKMPKIIE